MEKIFVAIRCNDDQGVIFVSFVMQGEVYLWWDAKAHLLRAEIAEAPIT